MKIRQGTKEFGAENPDKTDTVNFIFSIIMILHFTRWLYGLLFNNTKKDYQYAPESDKIYCSFEVNDKVSID